MPIELKYGSNPATVLMAGYAAGQNKNRNRQEAEYLPIVRDQMYMRQQAYQHGLDRQQRQQAINQQMVWPEAPDGKNLMGKDRVRFNAQKAANARALRLGKPIPFPDVEQGAPIPARIVQQRQHDDAVQKKEQARQNAINQRNQAGIDAANQRAADAEAGRNRRASDALKGKEVMPDPFVPGHDPEGKPVSTVDPSGYFGSLASSSSSGYGSQSLAATGLVGSAPPASPDFAGQYQAVMANLNQQLGQPQPQQGDVASALSATSDNPYFKQPSQTDASGYYG